MRLTAGSDFRLCSAGELVTTRCGLCQWICHCHQRRPDQWPRCQATDSLWIWRTHHRCRISRRCFNYSLPRHYWSDPHVDDHWEGSGTASKSLGRYRLRRWMHDCQQSKWGYCCCPGRCNILLWPQWSGPNICIRRAKATCERFWWLYCSRFSSKSSDSNEAIHDTKVRWDQGRWNVQYIYLRPPRYGLEICCSYRDDDHPGQGLVCWMGWFIPAHLKRQSKSCKI